MLEIEKEKPTEEPSGESFFENIPRKAIEVPKPKATPEKPETVTPQEAETKIPITEKGFEDVSEEGLITGIFELYKNKGGEVINDPEWIEKMNSLGEIISQAKPAKRFTAINTTIENIIEKSDGQLTEGFLATELGKAIERIKQNPQE